METEDLEEDENQGRPFTPATNKLVSAIFNLHFCQRISREFFGNVFQAIGDFCTTKEVNQRFLVSGGIGEGTVCSKDLDFMLLDTSIIVNQEVNDGSLQTPHFELQATMEEIKPGFAKLIVVNPESFPLMDCTTVKNGKHYLSSFLYIRKQAQKVSRGSNVEGTHGPAVLRGKTSEVHTENDVVYTLKSSQWPRNVLQAFKARVLHKWLTNEMVSYLENCGTFYVPIGNPMSSEKELEWRLSFSLIENYLIRSLNTVQYNCYCFLKLLGEKLHYFKEQKVLCSYFFKTALFWCIEEEDKIIWDENNILNCIALILKRMSLFYHRHNFPNYFIPENNMILHLPLDKCAQLAEEFTSITKDLLYNIFCSLPLGTKGEYNGVFGTLALQGTEEKISSKETRDHFYRDLVTKLESLDSSEVQALMETSSANISSSTQLYQRKYKRDIRNDLQNILDPNFFDFFDFLQSGCPFGTRRDALLSVIKNITNIIGDASFDSCYEQALYRALGNICHIEALHTADKDRQTMLQEEAEDYFKRGLEMVFPNGFDDQTFSGKVHLAQFHYMNNNILEAAQVLDEVKEVLDDEDLVMEIGDACICTEICVSEHLEALEHDQGLCDYFKSLSHKDSKFMNSVALAYYMRLKCYQKSQMRRAEASSLLHLQTEFRQRGEEEEENENCSYRDERYQKLLMNFEKFCTSLNETPSHALIDRILKDTSTMLLQIVENQ